MSARNIVSSIRFYCIGNIEVAVLAAVIVRLQHIQLIIVQTADRVAAARGIEPNRHIRIGDKRKIPDVARYLDVDVSLGIRRKVDVDDLKGFGNGAAVFADTRHDDPARTRKDVISVHNTVILVFGQGDGAVRNRDGGMSCLAVEVEGCLIEGNGAIGNGFAGNRLSLRFGCR